MEIPHRKTTHINVIINEYFKKHNIQDKDNYAFKNHI